MRIVPIMAARAPYCLGTCQIVRVKVHENKAIGPGIATNKQRSGPPFDA
jgi:hypothetical protein